MKTGALNLSRLKLLALRDFWMNGKTLVVSGLSAVGAVLLLSLLDVLKTPEPGFHAGLYGILLFGGGLIATSLMFNDLHQRIKNHAWFLLPASNFEKFLSRLLYSSLGYAVLSLAVYFAASALSEGLNLLLVGRAHKLFNPFDPAVGRKLLDYLVVQSVFFFGAVFYRKHPFVKTLLSVIVVLLAGGILFMGVLNSRFGDFHGQMALAFEFPAEAFKLRLDSRTSEELQGFIAASETILNVVYWAVLAPLFWSLSYYRLRKVQVSHGV